MERVVWRRKGKRMEEVTWRGKRRGGKVTEVQRERNKRSMSKRGKKEM